MAFLALEALGNMLVCGGGAERGRGRGRQREREKDALERDALERERIVGYQYLSTLA